MKKKKNQLQKICKQGSKPERRKQEELKLCGNRKQKQTSKVCGDSNAKMTVDNYRVFHISYFHLHQVHQF